MQHLCVSCINLSYGGQVWLSEKNLAREKQIEKSKTEKVNYRVKGVVRDNS